MFTSFSWFMISSANGARSAVHSRKLEQVLKFKWARRLQSATAEEEQTWECVEFTMEKGSWVEISCIFSLLSFAVNFSVHCFSLFFNLIKCQPKVIVARFSREKAWVGIKLKFPLAAAAMNKYLKFCLSYLLCWASWEIAKFSWC